MEKTIEYYGPDEVIDLVDRNGNVLDLCFYVCDPMLADDCGTTDFCIYDLADPAVGYCLRLAFRGREAAARKVGVSIERFDQLVAAGVFPAGFQTGGIELWDWEDLKEACFEHYYTVEAA